MTIFLSRLGILGKSKWTRNNILCENVQQKVEIVTAGAKLLQIVSHLHDDIPNIVMFIPPFKCKINKKNMTNAVCFYKKIP